MQKLRVVWLSVFSYAIILIMLQQDTYSILSCKLSHIYSKD